MSFAVDPEVARPLLAGWIAGAIVGLADTALLLLVLSRDTAWPTRLHRLPVSLPILGVVAVNAMLIGWTLVGIVLGAIYLGAPMPAFSLAVGGGWLALAALYAFVRGGVPGGAPRGELALVWGTVALAAAAFALLLPLLAGRR